MGFFSRYRGFVKGEIDLPVGGFRKHIGRYRLVHVVFGLAVLLVAWRGVGHRLTPAKINNRYAYMAPRVQQMYMTGLEIKYDPKLGLTTNSATPVVWSKEQMVAIRGSGVQMLFAKHPIQNLLVIDTSGKAEDFMSYKTAALVTKNSLVIQKPEGIQLVPLTPENSQTTGFTINKKMVDAGIQAAGTWLQNGGSEMIARTVQRCVLGGIVLLPLVALAITLRITVGFALITLLGWLISKFRVRVSYKTLFNALSILYLPRYILFFLLIPLGIFIPPVIKYLVMIACLAVTVHHAEK